MAVIGYEKALNLMKNMGWQARVTMQGETLLRVELYHPEQNSVYTVRRDSAKKLIPKCNVCGRINDETAICCYERSES